MPSVYIGIKNRMLIKAVVAGTMIEAKSKLKNLEIIKITRNSKIMARLINGPVANRFKSVPNTQIAVQIDATGITVTLEGKISVRSRVYRREINIYTKQPCNWTLGITSQDGQASFNLGHLPDSEDHINSGKWELLE